MVVYPNCKINLGLNIISKRPDGFHNIESVFYPVAWCDMLEIIPAASDSFVFDGLGLDCATEENICYKAWNLVKKHFDISGISMYLYKKIPFGAGLGGGSSDGAYVLMALNELFGLNIKRKVMAGLASELGSDCTFFLDNRPCFVSGTGGDIAPMELSLKGYYLMVVKPSVSVSTVQAYRMITPQKPVLQLSEVITRPVASWKKYLFNDFESPVMAQYPAIRKVKDRLYEMGAVYAAMSGSGSAVYGLFLHEVEADNDFAGCQMWKGWLD